jgi:hypothetical protein
MSFMLFLLSSVVYADAQVDKAERIRLSEEIKSLEKRGRWMAIDIKYREILSLKDASPSFRDHSIAAQAASNLGNMLATYNRVKRAYAIEEKEELKRWLDAIEQTTAPVEIIVSRSFKEAFTLKVAEDFYAPEDQNAFAYAQKLITKNRKFKGLLPYGEYSIGEEVFTLATIPFPADAEDLFQGHSKVKVQPPPAPPLISYMGPRVTIGGAYTGAGTPTSELSVNATSFSGMGGRASVGWQLRLRFGFDIFAELDVRNMMVSLSKKPTYLTDYGLTEEGTGYGGDQYLGAGLLSGVSYSINDLDLFAGFSLSQGTAVIQGLDTKTSQNYQSTCIEEDRNFSVCDESSGLQDALVMRGAITSGGLALGANYKLFSITDKLRGGINTTFAVQSDTSRTYYWGQIGLSITPFRSVKQ